MKTNKRKGIRILATLAICILTLSCFSVTAFAGADDVGQELPEVTETVEPVPEITAEPDAVPEPTPNPLTPDGNLTLVDDISTSDGQNKQFITVQSKSGNYFYIIIDRSDDKENVYFLNLVDEADLLVLIEDEEFVEDYYAQMYPDTTTPEPDSSATDTPDTVPAATEEPANSNNLGTILIVVLVVAAAGGGYWYFKFGRNRKPKDEDMDFYDDEGYEEDPYLNEDELIETDDGNLPDEDTDEE